MADSIPNSFQSPTRTTHDYRTGMETLDSILKKHVARGQDTKEKLLGAAFVLTNKEEIFYSGAAGRIDLNENAKPFSANSFTWIASLTKLMTTTCLMQLVEKEMIGLDEDIRGLIPELGNMQILRRFDDDGAPVLEDNHKPITLRMLLTHTLGLGYDIADPDLVKWSAFISRTATNLDWSRDGFTTPLKMDPGQGWYYGAAVDWAGILLETITGWTLGEYMAEHVFEPLRMNDTGFWPERLPQTRDRAVAYVYRDGDELKTGESPVPETHEMESGGAGLFSTPWDCALFLRGLLQGKLVEEGTLGQMFAPQLNAPQSASLETILYNLGVQDALAPEFPTGLPLNYGLGGVMNMEDVPGKRKKGSMMWSGMANSRWWIDRETGIGAALIVNVQPHGDAVVKKLYHELELAVYDALESA